MIGLVIAVLVSVTPPPGPPVQRWFAFEDQIIPVVRRFEFQRKKPFAAANTWAPFNGWSRENTATICRQNIHYVDPVLLTAPQKVAVTVWECWYRVPDPDFIYRVRSCNNAGCSPWYQEVEIQCQAPTLHVGGGCPGWFWPSAIPCPRSDNCP